MWKRIKRPFKKLPPWLTNPFTIAISLFVFWMMFMDENSIPDQYRKHRELSALLSKRDFYVEQIKETDKQYFELTTNPATQEKFAREHYRMKRDNEDVFVIVDEK